MAIVAGDGYVCAGDDDRVEVTIGRFAEGLKSRLDVSLVLWKGEAYCGTVEDDSGAGLQVLQVDGARWRS